MQKHDYGLVVLLWVGDFLMAILVSAQISNVCITRHAALNAIAYTVCVKQFVKSLPAISLGDWFSVSRKGGTGGGGLVLYTQRVKTVWLCVGLAVKIPIQLG